MKLHVKIILLISTLLIITGLFLFFLIQSDNGRKNFLIRSMNEGKALTIDAAFRFHTQKLQQVVLDYSAWDELIAQLDNPRWIESNTSGLITVYDYDFVWIYNKAGELIFRNTGIDFDTSVISNPFQQGLFAKSPSVQFYNEAKDGNIVEICGATIVPTIDLVSHSTPAQGYLFIGKVLDKDMLRSLESLTDCNISLQKPRNTENAVFLLKNLSDANGKKRATIYITKQSTLLEDWNRVEVIFFIITVLMILIFTLLTFYFINKWVTDPLDQIHFSIIHNDTTSLDDIATLNNEIGLIALSLKKSFEMQDELKKEVQMRRRIESKLKAYTIELKELSSTKDKFLSLIAHDVSNPLNNLVGFSELLANNCKTYDIEKIQKFARVLNHDAVNSTELLKNLLFWARAQAGNTIFAPDKVDLFGCAEEIYDLFASSAAFKRVEVEVHTCGDTHLIADRNMLMSIIRNLLSNALKYTPSGGTVSLSINGNDDKVIQLTVSDSGVGMTVEQIANLFKNAAKSTNGIRGEHGTGLGLYLCKEFAERHGGKLTIESEPKKGSSFIVSLPRRLKS